MTMNVDMTDIMTDIMMKTWKTMTFGGVVAMTGTDFTEK
jgi:hypothetical protein